MRCSCAIVCVAAAELVLAACGDDGGENNGVDGGSIDAATSSDAAPAPDDLVDYVTGDVGAVLGYRESSQWNFEYDDAWMVRAMRHIPTGTSTFDVTMTLYADDPGTSGLAAGAVACEITGTDEVFPVDGFDPLDRVRLELTIETNDCTDATGVTLEYVYEVRERGPGDEPTLIAAWQLLDVEETDPFPGWLWADGRANPWRPCAASERAEGRDYCEVGCSWDNIFEPEGTDCVE